MKTMLWLAVFLSVVPGRSRGATPETVQLEITCPVEGTTYTRGFTFTANLTGAPDKTYIAVLQCFGVTHHLLCDSQGTFAPIANRNGKIAWGLHDRYLLPEPGDHILEIAVFEQGNTIPLQEDRIRFRMERMPDDELQKELKRISNWLIWSVKTLRDNIERSDVDRAKRTPRSGSKLSEASRDELSNRYHLFTSRMKAFGEAAEFYEQACRPGEALRALRFAHEIYAREGAAVTNVPEIKGFPVQWDTKDVSYPPKHFFEFAVFYARRKDLKQTERWFLEYTAWWKRQHEKHPFLSAREKEKCLEHSLWPYLELARLHYMLYQDMDACEQWMEKYKANMPPGRTR